MGVTNIFWKNWKAARRVAGVFSLKGHQNQDTTKPFSGKTSFTCPSAAVKLPCITTSMPQPDFPKFKIDWSVCKTITSIPV